MTDLMPVAEARQRITGALRPVAAEVVGIAEAAGRVLAADVAARVTQPPVAVSAMDGYAVRAADVADPPARLRVVGSAPAGGGHDGRLGAGEAVRIFTGGPLPDGADAIVIQEDTTTDGEAVVVREAAAAGRYVRRAGLDFTAGDVLLRAGRLLGARDVGLAAAMDVPWLSVRRRPRVALLATGDEIVRPGEPRGRHQIVSSNALALAALIRSYGGQPLDLGIAPDTRDGLAALVAGAAGADLLVTMGGASVGDHDLVQGVLADQGLDLDFWRIAMRPGKPLMFGTLGPTAVLGLPGNPVSSLVCGLVFLVPALAALLGRAAAPASGTARLGRDLPANDRREDYLRATLKATPEGVEAHPFERQDSSMLSLLAQAQCLVIRPPHAPPAARGDRVAILRLDADGGGI